jgi:hypothetical protein
MWLEVLLLLLLSQQAVVDQRLGARSVEEETEEALEAVGLGHAMPTPRGPSADRDAAADDLE